MNATFAVRIYRAGMTVLTAGLLVGAGQSPDAKKGNAPPGAAAESAVASLPAALEALRTAEGGNYHRLLWRAYHLVHDATIGRPWSELGPVLDRLPLTRLGSRKDQWGITHSFRFKREAYVAPRGQAHEMLLEFYTRMVVTNDKPSIATVANVSVKLVAEIGKPFAEFARNRPYTANSILARALEMSDVGHAAVAFPVLSTLEVEYRSVAGRHDEFNSFGFAVLVEFVDQAANPTSGRRLFIAAHSGLDAEEDWRGNKRTDGFRSNDTLGELFATGSNEWHSGWGNGHHKLERIERTTSPAAAEWAEVNNASDVRALTPETRRVRVMAGEFGSAAIRALAGIARLQELDCADDALNDVDLTAIAALSRLKGLRLRGGQITDGGIARLARLPVLESLSIWNGQKLTDECCRSLGQIRSLRRLDLGWTKGMSHQGIRHLGSLSDLEEFSPGGVVTDRGLELIAEFSHLKELSLGNTDQITPAGLAHLSRLKDLRSLTIGFSSVGDDGLRKVADLSTIERLQLHGLPITDAGLFHLKSLRNLRYLYITKSERVTDAGMAALQAHLPGRYERR